MKMVQIALALLALLLSRSPLVADAHAGQVIFWGYVGDSAPWPSAGVVTIAGQVLTNIVAVAAGYKHSLALRSDGTVVGWGLNNSGQATGSASINPDRASGVVKIDGQVLSNVVAVAAGSHFSLALKSDGTVVEWGNNVFGQTSMLAGLSNVVAIAAEGDNSLALKRDGSVVGWGSLHIPPGLSNIVGIATGQTLGGFGAAGGIGLVLKSWLLQRERFTAWRLRMMARWSDWGLTTLVRLPFLPD
jgi:hypothetical protein